MQGFSAIDGHSAEYSAMAEDSTLSVTTREAAMCFSIAEGHFARQEYEEAVVAAQEAAEAFRAKNDHVGLADALRVKIASLREQGQRREALDVVSVEMENFENMDDAERGIACMRLSEAEVRLNKMGPKNRERALEIALEAKRIFMELGEQKMEGATALTIFNIHTVMLDKRRELALEAVIGGSRGRAEGHAVDAIRAIKAETAKEMEEIAQQAFDIYEGINDKAGMGKAMHCLAQARVRSESRDDWLEPAERAVRLFDEAGLKQLEAIEMHFIAEYHYGKEQLDEAVKAGKGALVLMQAAGLQGRWQSHTVRTIVNAHLKTEDHTAALVALKRQLLWCQKTGDKEGQASVQDMLASLHSVSDNPKKAVDAAAAALKIIRDLGDTRWESQVQCNMAKVHLERRRFPTALKSITDSLAAFRKADDKWGIVQCLSTLVNLRLATGDEDSALTSAQELAQFLEDKEEKSHQAGTLHIIFQIYMNQKKAPEALQAIQTAASLYGTAGEMHRQAAMTVLSGLPYEMKGSYQQALDSVSNGLQMARNCAGDEAEAYALLLIDQMNAKMQGSMMQGMPQQQYAPVDMAMTVAAPVAARAGQAPAADSAAGTLATGPKKIGFDIEVVMNRISQLAALTADVDDMMIDSPFMDVGMDSLAAINFRNDLVKAFDGMKIPGTVVFDFPTVRAVSQDIVQRSIDDGMDGAKWSFAS